MKPLISSSISSASSPKKSPSKLNKHGTDFERKCNDAFHSLETKYPIIWERIIDSKAAGNLIRVAEGDFRLRVRSKYKGLVYEFLIECKASSKEETFARCFKDLIGEDQLPLMRKHRRAGVICIYFFYSTKTKQIEIWTMQQLRENYYEKRKPLEDQPRYILPASKLKAFAQHLVVNPEGFISILGDAL